MYTKNKITVFLFCSIIFVSAFLLFLIQPFTARLYLPLAGGSPSLWNACMVFFQLLLLSGYGLIHLIASKFELKKQMLIVFCVLFLPFFFFPILAPESAPPQDSDPTFWFLSALVFTVGAPFLVLSMSSPLLQKWLSNTSFDVAKDPYFLYAASNAGSLLGLLGYPFFVEPFLGLKAQSFYFERLYAFFVFGMIGCGILCYFYKKPDLPEQKCFKADVTDAPHTKIPLKKLLYWVFMAFIPSSLSLGVTHHLSTEIASFPLLWALPLSVYLLTHIIAFSNSFKVSDKLIDKILTILICMIVFAFLRHSNEPILLVILLHLAFLFFSGLFCHKLLADSRPSSENLTIFYLMLALGGSLGGIFNALVAPFLFNSILEYPIAIALLAFIRKPYKESQNESQETPFYKQLLVPIIIIILMLLVRHYLGDRDSTDIWQLLLRDSLPLILVIFFSATKYAFAFSIAVILMFAAFFPSPHGKVIYSQRTFFGVHRVSVSPDKRFVQIIHGTTVHGLQNREPDKRLLPTSYFHPSGPVGQIFESIRADQKQLAQVGIIGLGAGAIAAYGMPGENFSYFEIDPAVIKIASDNSLFTYLSDSKATIRNVLGDGRKTLELEENNKFDLLIMDAFSSDSAPIHLLTREAFELYLSKMKDSAILAINISNRYLTMENVISATLNELGLVVYHQEDYQLYSDQKAEGKAVSFWLVAARKEEHLGSIVKNLYWVKMSPPPDAKRWTDDRSTLMDMIFAD